MSQDVGNRLVADGYTRNTVYAYVGAVRQFLRDFDKPTPINRPAPSAAGSQRSHWHQGQC
jgi:hypothetical protein